jgi:flagellar motor switch protein FliG
MTALTRIGQITPGASLTAARSLSRRQKAAIIVRLLARSGDQMPLAALPDDLQSGLTEAMGMMRPVDRATLVAVVEEFAQELENLGLSFPDGLAGALSVLEGQISPDTAARLRRQAGVRQSGDPWARLRGLRPDELVPLLDDESVEVAAVVLSKLDTGKAAQVLAAMPGPRARRVTYAIAQTGAVTPDAVDRIGLSLAAQLDARPERAFTDTPETRVGAILNHSPALTRDAMLAGLDETDRAFADKVRRALFTFPDIPLRLSPRDVPRITRAVDQDVLVTALAGAAAPDTAPAADFILANMSGRMADALREQVREKGTVKPKLAEEAMGAVLQAIRSLEASGEIRLVLPDDSDD